MEARHQRAGALQPALAASHRSITRRGCRVAGVRGQPDEPSVLLTPRRRAVRRSTLQALAGSAGRTAGMRSCARVLHGRGRRTPRPLRAASRASQHHTGPLGPDELARSNALIGASCSAITLRPCVSELELTLRSVPPCTTRPCPIVGRFATHRRGSNDPSALVNLRFRYRPAGSTRWSQLDGAESAGCA